MDQMEMGTRLQKLRREKGVTADRAAKDLEISLKSIRAYESGEREPRDEVKLRMAAYYGVNMQDLFSLGIRDGG